MSENSESATDTSRAQEQATDTMRCPSCGGKIFYSPSERALKCEYCGSRAKIDMNSFCREQDFQNLLQSQNNTWSNETHVLRCNSCGAKTVISRKDISLQCPFCGTTNVVQTTELCGLKPNAVLPFLIDRKQACQAVIGWAKNKLFAPKKFKKEVYPESIYGNYTPAFTFDTATFSRYYGRLGKTKTRTVRVRGKMITETYTEWYAVRGDFRRDFDDVLVQASDAIGQRNIDAISPFDTNASQNYSSDFLQGFTASQYTRTGQECWGYARGVMANAIRSAILQRYSYDVIDFLNVDTDWQNITYKYVLLPVYIGHFNFRNKLYNFFVNGRTGKATGKAPISPLRVSIAVLAGLAIVVGVALLIYSLTL